MREDFETYRCAKQEEWQKLIAEGQKVSDTYKDVLMGVGEEAEPPIDIPVARFLTCLSTELRTLTDHMVIGRDYATMESLRAYSQVLQDASCEHFTEVEVKEAKTYCTPSEEANSAAVCFFEAFWRPDACNIALLRMALSRG